MKAIFALGLSMASCIAHAAPPVGGPPAGLEDALKVCSATSGKTPAAMDACMAGKGFTRPPGDPGGLGTPGPNERGGPYGLEDALKACSSSTKVGAGNRSDMAAMDACMSSKGFSKPLGAPPQR